MNEHINGNRAGSDVNAPKVVKKARTINGINEGLYNRVVAKVGYPKRGKIRINTAVAVKLKAAGFSYKQIGSYMEVSGCTVKRRLKEAGLISP
jgi:DNA invertase Pin-like site-specific DNA recombinase